MASAGHSKGFYQSSILCGSIKTMKFYKSKSSITDENKIRFRRNFLLYPITINGITKWLEYAAWEEK